MPINTDDLLGLAKDLAHIEQSTEVRSRAAVSRAYYAAYLKANLLDERVHESADPAGGVHAQRISKLINIPVKHNLIGLSESQVKKIRSIAYVLQDLKAKRVLADYHIERDCSDAFARQAVSAAEAVINKLDDLYDDLMWLSMHEGTTAVEQARL